MDLAQHILHRRSWSSGAFPQDGLVTFPSSVSKQVLEPAKEQALGLPHNQRARSRSAPSILPTLILRAPHLYGAVPSFDIPPIDTSHLSPPNTIAPSYLSPIDATALHANGRRPSTPPTMPKSPIRPAEEAIGPSDARKLMRLLDRVLHRRTQLEYQTDSWFRNHKFLDESAEALSAAINATDSHNATQAQLEKIDELRVQYHGDYDSIQSQSRILRSLQSNLSNLEFTLKAKESTLLHIIQTAAGPLASNTSGSDSHDAYTATSIKSNTHILLRQYYDRKGDEGIYMERLQEHDIFYSEGIVEREMVRDRGDPLPLGDEQYEREFRDQRDIILKDLATAQADVANLRAQCEAIGLDTEVTPQGLHDEEGSSPDSAAYDDMPPPMIRGDLLQGVADRESFDNRPSADARDHNIGEWLQTVSAEPAEQQHDDIAVAEEPTQEIEPRGPNDHETEPQVLQADCASNLQSEQDGAVPNLDTQAIEQLDDFAFVSATQPATEISGPYDLLAALWSSPSA
ncbi:hypothetical protein LTR56_014341 [Elasticomyces elasticus]|nr:hypothetical protein LTR56_014341 [Elasticomyces elasticus]KAK3636371.1 hypothetical protein LTR22_018747 [Elasticomyces elasticus]KAK4916597.1 hypothetical protein LTR49_015430 [Elasticomyces elasticus]KAK5756166.1 hypothetical protein LTS12_013719 [Elasticomyces elasticus]